MSWLVILIALILLWVISNLYRLFTNYLVARRTGFPIVVAPFNPQNVFWMILGVPLRQTLRRYLPTWLFQRANLTIYGYEFFTKYHFHDKFGSNFILVTCGNNELNIGEPDLANEILKRPKDFIMSLVGSRVMRLFGDNLITSNGEHWARQRKMVASNINERVSKMVWSVSQDQTSQMLKGIVEDVKGVTNEYTEYLKTVAVNVLARAGYGVDRKWQAKIDEEPLPGYRFTYIEATRLAIDHIVEASFISHRLLLQPFMPQILQDVGHAIKEFPKHTQTVLDRERQQPSENVNIMSMLVRESDAAEKSKAEGQESTALTEDEIMGNLFVFTAAGFDTTATTMGYTMTLLAKDPKLQDWIIEEIDSVLAGKRAEDVDYAGAFPKFNRCLAVMLETLRLYPPVLHIARQSPPILSAPITITTTDNKQCHIPQNTIIYINSVAIQTDPSIWGPDSLAFSPKRWIIPSTSSAPESVKTMPKGTFLSWSGGPRNCPGMKMSQVEFVAVFTVIFSKFRVELMLKEGESQEDGVKRVDETLADSQSRLTLQMNRPENVKIRFVKRK